MLLARISLARTLLALTLLVWTSLARSVISPYIVGADVAAVEIPATLGGPLAHFVGGLTAATDRAVRAGSPAAAGLMGLGGIDLQREAGGTSLAGVRAHKADRDRA